MTSRGPGMMLRLAAATLLASAMPAARAQDAPRTWDLRKLAVAAQASSFETNHEPGQACDGDLYTRWSSAWSNDQWISIDLGEPRALSEVVLHWETAHALDYALEVSADGVRWTTVRHVTNGAEGAAVFPLVSTTSRYVRVTGFRRATPWGFSLREFVVRGPAPGIEPEYGGLIRPHPIATIFDQDWENLSKRFAEQCALDPASSAALSDDAFLDLIEKRAFDFFWYEADPDTFFMVDSTTWKVRTSVAAIGMQLGAYIAGHYRKYLPPKEIYERVERLLDNCWDDPADPSDLCLEHHDGWTYHWVNIKTGRWEGEEHICTHDSIMYLCGVIAAKHYFAGTRAGEIASRILDGVKWDWIIHGGRNAKFVSNCYAKTYDPPCAGDVRFYDGMKFDYLLPIGGPGKAVPASYWHNYGLDFPWDSYRGHFWRIERPALWIHQWDNLWFDFRFMKDDYADYFQNSVEAVLANRQWCLDHRSYDENLWGLNPCQGPPHGDGVFYGSYGAPQDDLPFQKGTDNDGTVTPTAILPSILFAPTEVIRVARFMYDRYKDRFWRRYGFTDALNPSQDWFSREYLAIDQGPILINIENYRSGLLHRYFGMEETVWNGLRRAGFVGIVDNFDESEHSPPYAAWSTNAPRGSFRLERVRDRVKEGSRALRVTWTLPPGATNAFFAARPGLKDFSPYRYLAFWSQGDPGFRPTVVRQDGQAVALRPTASRPADYGWVKKYYSLPEEARTDGIAEVRFALAKPGAGTCWLDAVLLTYDLPTNELGFAVDDFALARPGWMADASLRVAPENVPEVGGRGLRIDLGEPASPDGWVTIPVSPRFSDWSRFHSIALWARGSAVLRLRLRDGTGRSFDVGTRSLAEADGWQHLLYNIQANLNPRNCWEPRYDKRDIRELLVLVRPSGTNVQGSVRLGPITLTE
ncbi:MAG: glucoamylase family protein [Verrucomicrobiota bacterium]